MENLAGVGTTYLISNRRSKTSASDAGTCITGIAFGYAMKLIVIPQQFKHRNTNSVAEVTEFIVTLLCTEAAKDRGAWNQDRGKLIRILSFLSLLSALKGFWGMFSVLLSSSRQNILLHCNYDRWRKRGSFYRMESLGLSPPTCRL